MAMDKISELFRGAEIHNNTGRDSYIIGLSGDAWSIERCVHDIKLVKGRYITLVKLNNCPLVQILKEL